MKKIFVIALAICSAFAVTSCKSSKDAYQSAYEEARLAEGQGQQSDVVEIAPVASSTVKDMAELKRLWWLRATKILSRHSAWFVAVFQQKLMLTISVTLF